MAAIRSMADRDSLEVSKSCPYALARPLDEVGCWAESDDRVGSGRVGTTRRRVGGARGRQDRLRQHGRKLASLSELVRIQEPGEKQEPWMIFKKRDEWAQSTDDYDFITALPDSVVSKTLGLVESRPPGCNTYQCERTRLRRR